MGDRFSGGSAYVCWQLGLFIGFALCTMYHCGAYWDFHRCRVLEALSLYPGHTIDGLVGYDVDYQLEG